MFALPLFQSQVERLVTLSFWIHLLKVHTQGVNHAKFAMCAILAAGSFAFVAESEEKDKRGCIYYAETSMDSYLMNCLI